MVTSLSFSVGKFEKGKDMVGWLNNFENILMLSAGDDASVLPFPRVKLLTLSLLDEASGYLVCESNPTDYTALQDCLISRYGKTPRHIQFELL